MLRTTSLTRDFSSFRAVDNITLHVKKGEAFALLGPNGAGKTTVVRMLTTLLLPTAGSAEINGFDLVTEHEKIKKHIGIVHQRMNIDNDLTAKENLLLHARLHHMDMVDARVRIDELLDFVELSDRRDMVIRNFSGGMKRRLMIARSVLHRPDMLFLDEPTVGLDPQVRRRIWELLRKMNSEGLTLLLTTHYIEEAEHLCDRVAIMDKGKLLLVESPEILRARQGKFVVELFEPHYEQIFFPSRKEAMEYAAMFEGSFVRKTTLEDVFVQLTGRKVTEL